MPVYVEIPSLYVPIEARVAAWRALEEHYERLRPPWGKPPLVWVDEEERLGSLDLYKIRLMSPGMAIRRHPWDRSVWGWANTDSTPRTAAVYVNVRQPIDQIPRTVAHEVRHHWQYQTAHPVSEDDAHRYAGDGPYRDVYHRFGPDVAPKYI